MSKVITRKVRLSYAHLVTPKLFENEKEAKYRTVVLVDKKDKENLKIINDAIAATVKEGIAKFGDDWTKDTKKDPFNLPLWDGDEDVPVKDGYEGCMCFNASNTIKPGIVDKNLQKIIDPDEIYSGMYARLSINFFPYQAAGNRGVAASLQNVMKVGEGERLDNKVSAEADFAGIEQFEDLDEFAGQESESYDDI